MAKQYVGTLQVVEENCPQSQLRRFVRCSPNGGERVEKVEEITSNSIIVQCYVLDKCRVEHTERIDKSRYAPNGSYDAHAFFRKNLAIVSGRIHVGDQDVHFKKRIYDRSNLDLNKAVGRVYTGLDKRICSQK